jgi:hypothetical protein
MRITLTDGDGERLMNGTVNEKAVTQTWVDGCVDAAWSYLRYTGSDEIVVRSKDKPASDDGSYVRVCTVALTIHEDET